MYKHVYVNGIDEPNVLKKLSRYGKQSSDKSLFERFGLATSENKNDARRCIGVRLLLNSFDIIPPGPVSPPTLTASGKTELGLN